LQAGCLRYNLLQFAVDFLARLMEGNERFRNGRASENSYDAERLQHIARGTDYLGAVLTCVDGRLSPEIIFDQPLGSFFTCRVPGNTPKDSAVWTFEMAAGAGLPFGLVLGHTECIAIGQVVTGVRSDSDVEVAHASAGTAEDLGKVIRMNAIRTAEETIRKSSLVREAVARGTFAVRVAIYDVHTGSVSLLDT
jgi:carbonic anhydrase